MWLTLSLLLKQQTNVNGDYNQHNQYVNRQYSIINTPNVPRGSLLVYVGQGSSMKELSTLPLGSFFGAHFLADDAAPEKRPPPQLLLSPPRPLSIYFLFFLTI